MDYLPFSLDKPLAETIKAKYLMNALRWIGDFRDPFSHNLLGAKTGNTWGVGYGLICLLKSRSLYLSDGDFPRDFDTKSHNAIQFLIDRASLGQSTCNWDNNIWDTSVVCRALLHYIDHYPKFNDRDKVVNICCEAIRWLFNKVEVRESRRYSLGILDLSQMVRTLIFAKKNSYVESCIREQKIFADLSIDKVIYYLVNEVIHSVEIKEQNCDGECEKIAVWDDDVFASADAIISLSKYIQLENLSNDFSEQRKEIIDLLQPALRYLELEHINGRWGIEETTTIALQAYILGSKVIGGDQPPEPHIVFKSIRYLCDPKTVFADGSIAHKMEPTVYMILAFLEVLNNWELPGNILEKKSVHELYDYVIWNTPTRATHERIKRLQVQSEAILLKNELMEAKNKIIKLEHKLHIIETTFLVGFWIFLGSVILFILRFVVFNGPIFIFDWRVQNWEVLLAFATPWLGFGWFLYERVYRANSGIVKK